MSRYLLCLLTIFTSLSVYADCTDNLPLFSTTWKPIKNNESPYLFGEWALPVSSNKPNTITKGRIKIEIETQNEALVKLKLYFLPTEVFGLPFTIQFIRLSYDIFRIDTRLTSDLDLSNNCSSLGQSFYPGGFLTLQIPLKSVLSLDEIKSLNISVWGSRN